MPLRAAHSSSNHRHLESLFHFLKASRRLVSYSYTLTYRLNNRLPPPLLSRDLAARYPRFLFCPGRLGESGATLRATFVLGAPPNISLFPHC